MRDSLRALKLGLLIVGVYIFWDDIVNPVMDALVMVALSVPVH